MVRITLPCFNQLLCRLLLLLLLFPMLHASDYLPFPHLLSVSSDSINGFETLFNPNDILPLLPRQVSWLIVNSLHSAVDLLPAFVGAGSIEGNNNLELKGACFYKNIAWLELQNKSNSEFGGGTLHIKPAYAANMWNEALNKRLGTQVSQAKLNLSLPDVLVEVEKRGSSFAKLLTIPEQDDWVYSDGKSTSCVTFILEMYKEAGLFGELASSIQVTEFTIKDAYSLKFFENNSSRLPRWCNADDSVKLPFCQIKGKYPMELPGYNSMDPYPYMNERCPSMPPKYYRPQGC
ncbi:hypothetical protein RND71_037658 [Anisodus tanguticus]|uniref:Uncharacterized protein n=1 Tax=Anisodus tanguticus TaxID=243964 RepID=A0AAE1UST4_9SOLA|nr:hypothetical protein RND71_037658 [Anisodus tanguticus]